MTDEVKVRNQLTEHMEEIAKTWELFAQRYHGHEYVDGEHAFGVLVREYHEMIDHVIAMQNLIKEYEEKHIGSHYFADTGKLMEDLKRHAVYAAEEAVQIAAVAMKTIQSRFVKESDKK